MCKECGADASSQSKTLKKPCPREWGGLHNGRRNGYNRFMAGKHPCLAKVLIEGQRAVTAADMAEGVRSCARHEVYWSHSSERGGQKAGLPEGLRGRTPPGECTGARVWGAQWQQPQQGSPG